MKIVRKAQFSEPNKKKTALVRLFFSSLSNPLLAALTSYRVPTMFRILRMTLRPYLSTFLFVIFAGYIAIGK